MPKNQYNIPILMYHRVVLDPSKESNSIDIWVSLQHLERQFEFLKSRGIEPITFERLRKPATASIQHKVILTFDDGYTDNYDLLFPLLKKYGFTAVIFLVSRRTFNQWDVDQNGTSSYALLHKDQMLEMKEAGIEFGSHTQTHPNLLNLDNTTLENEIMSSKRDIDLMLAQDTISFAYPYGSCNEKIKSMVKNAGYQFGVSTKNGPYSFWEDPFQIRRQVMRSGTGLFQFRRKVSGYYYHPNPLKSVFY